MTSTDFTLPDPKSVSIDGSLIATYALGPVDAEQVVFCHGTPWSAAVWADAARYLSDGYRVHLWDMPGYGRSAKDADIPVDLASQMARFSRLLKLWGVRRPHVVAHDVGGAVALGAHLLHGSDYASLSLWDVVTLDPWGSPFFRLVSEHSEVFTALPPSLHAALVKEYAAGAALHRLSDAWLDRLSSPWTGRLGQEAFYRQIAALHSGHTRPVVDRLDQVRCPVAIGWGANDPWVPVEQSRRLRRALPGTAPLLILDDVGHLAPVEASHRVRSAVRSWIETADSTADPAVSD